MTDMLEPLVESEERMPTLEHGAITEGMYATG